jgi:pyridoxal phosphate enzyme (YggS family)
MLREALSAGALHLGENYAQELRDKAADLRGDDPAPIWHFIGRLQRNKVKYVAGAADLFHAFDNLKLAAVFESRRETPLDVLVAVNTGGEASKGGIPAEEALAFCKQVMLEPGVNLRGLMTIPPAVAKPSDAAPFFRTMAELRSEGLGMGLPLHELSMGMSGDFEEAIKYGATLVRVGTAIFGPRAYPV